jgi:hypothetical protein
MGITILLNIIVTTTESISFILYFLKCHNKRYSNAKLFLILLLSVANGLLPSYILPNYAMLISLIGLFLIFFIFFSKYMTDFILSIGIIYLIMLSSNMITDLLIIKYIKYIGFANSNKFLNTMFPLALSELFF